MDSTHYEGDGCLGGHTGWQPPRCSHGHILLGCPHDDCPEQGAYLAAQREQILNWEARLQAEARRVVREELGLPPEEDDRG